MGLMGLTLGPTIYITVTIMANIRIHDYGFWADYNTHTEYLQKYVDPKILL